MEFEGIVIRRTNYKEGAAMITVLTKDKMRSFLAKGVLKMTSKNAPSVNLFTKSKFEVWHGQDGDWLRQGEIIESYPDLNGDLEKLAILDFISETTNNLLGDNDARFVYMYLENTLKLMNEGFSPWTVLLIYFGHVLRESGYYFVVHQCVKCGSPKEIVSLSYKDGGFICKNCFDENKHTKMPVKKLKMLRYMFFCDAEVMDKVTFGKEEVLDIISDLCEFLDWTSQIQFKSLTLLKQI